VAWLGSTVLRTCVRVMKPAGKLWLTTHLVGQMHEVYEVYRAVPQELGLVDSLTALDAHVHHRATIASVRRMLTGAGFEPLEVVTDTLRMRCADGSSFLRHSFIRLGFLPAWQSVVLPDAVERTFAVLERQRNTGAAERGELALTIPMACVEAQKPGAVAV
jgi:arsenite methyltransferase